MKIRKTFECGNDWSVEISKPHKSTLQVSIFKKAKQYGLDGSYWWSQYFDLKDMKNGGYVNHLKVFFLKVFYGERRKHFQMGLVQRKNHGLVLYKIFVKINILMKIYWNIQEK